MPSAGRDRPGDNRVVKLQILAAVFLPIALFMVWLGSHGFFSPPA